MLAAWVCTVALGTLASRGNAQGTGDPTGGIPPGYEKIESEDLTLTIREDNISTVAVDPTDPMVEYVGTNDGRVYKTTDRGQTWNEATAVTQTRRLWQTTGSNIFFGKIRSDGGSYDLFDPALAGLASPPTDFSRINIARVSPSVGAINLDARYRPQNGDLPGYTGLDNVGWDPLLYETSISAGGNQGFLGVGLSARSPRLSLLTGSRGRPVPVLNRQRLLLLRSLNGTRVQRITVDPNDHDRLFAATDNGLYKSYNGGVSWVRTFGGMRQAERMALNVKIRPGTPKLAILGTAGGAYSSTDDGENWTKIATIFDTGINDIAFDPHDNTIIYVATQIGVLRSNDGGKTYIPIYYSTFPQENDIQAVVVDPFDDDTVYIGTMRGAFVTHKARTGSYTDWKALEGVQSILSVTRFAACTRHKGHIYALTRLMLPNINYGATNPESGIWESFDGGHIWRPIFSGQTSSEATHFALDAKDPDTVWVAWWMSVHRLSRASTLASEGASSPTVTEPEGPTMTEVIQAALRYQGLELDDYSRKIQLAQSSKTLPRRFDVYALYWHWDLGGKLDDNQYALNRYLWVNERNGWQIWAFATWALPERYYNPASVPLLRTRELQLNDELRKFVFEEIQRNYGEIERLYATLANVPLDLRTRVIYRLRIEQLEALVDMVCGNYLSRWKKQHRRHE
jgi:hypothetical protein